MGRKSRFHGGPANGGNRRKPEAPDLKRGRPLSADSRHSRDRD